MDLRLFGKNTLIYMVGNLGLRAASFLLIPVYTHLLTVSEYGFLAILLISIQILMMFMNMGMDICILRFIKVFKERNELEYLLGSSTLINIMSGIVFILIAIFFLIPLLGKLIKYENIELVLILVCFSAFLQSLFYQLISFYRADNNAAKFMMVSLVSALLLFLFSFFLIYLTRLNLIAALFGYIITYLVGFIFLSIDIFGKNGFKISLKCIPNLLKFGIPLIFSQTGQFLIKGSIAVYFISIFCGLKSVAIYSIGYKISTILLIVVILPFQLSFQPFIFSNLDKKDIKDKVSHLFTYLLLSISFMTFIILSSSRFFLRLITPPEYSNSFLVSLLLLPGIAFVGVYYFGETLINIKKKTHIIGLVMIISSIISLLLYSILIPILDIFGAVISVDFTIIISSVLIFFIGLKQYKVNLEWDKVVKIEILFLMQIIIIYFLKFTNDLVFLISSCGIFIVELILTYFFILKSPDINSLKRSFSIGYRMSKS